MWLEQIILKDFRCFYGDHTLNLSTDPQKNVTLIHAENGVGKTTILNALLWCFYGTTTAKFEQRDDLVNYDAKASGAHNAFVEIVFEHNDQRYRARRYASSVASERNFSIMRIDGGHSRLLTNPDTFINTVIPKDMASHFLFDGEHAEVFTAENNRSRIRKAVQDILGCNLIETAISDLEDTATYYRRQMPKTKAAASIEKLSEEIDNLAGQIVAARDARENLKQEAELLTQQIADIDAKLRNAAAAKELQARRDSAQRDLARAQSRERDAKEEVLRWLGDNGRFLVSKRITESTFDHLQSQETKGRIPSPYNEEFVKDLLEIERCICGAPLAHGSQAYAKVAELLNKAANHVLRSRLNGVRAVLSQLKSERQKAPGRLEVATKRQAEAEADISRAEAQLAEISEKLSGINTDEIAEREARRNKLRADLSRKDQQIGEMNTRIDAAEATKDGKDRELRKAAETDDSTRIFGTRYALCEVLKARLEKELEEEEATARKVLRASIGKILDKTSRKTFRLRMSDEYVVSLTNEAGTQLPKTGGENQLLGLAFTAALIEFAKIRQNAKDHRLLRGTVAPLVLDSPFGQLDHSYRETTAQTIPQMAGQVVLLVSSSQGSKQVIDAIESRVGAEYVLVRHNKDADRSGKSETQQFHGKDYQSAIYGAQFDGSSIAKVG